MAHKVRIRELRERRGWSLDRLARESDVDIGNLSRIERGEQEPSVTSGKVAGAVESGAHAAQVVNLRRARPQTR